MPAGRCSNRLVPPYTPPTTLSRPPAPPAGRIAGELSFGLSSGARYGLEPLFAALAERYPALHLRVRQDSAAPLIADLRQGRLDIAVTFGAQIPGDLQHERLKNEPVVLAVAADHPLADCDTVALDELRDETFALDVPGATLTTTLPSSTPVGAAASNRAPA